MSHSAPCKAAQLLAQMRVRRRASRTDHLSRGSALWWTGTLYLTSDHLSHIKDNALIDLPTYPDIVVTCEKARASEYVYVGP